MPDGLVMVLLAATPKPVGPSPGAQKFDPNAITPGTIGFVVTFAMVIAVIFLLRDFSKRVRRITLKGQEAERRAAEQGGAAAGGSTAGPAPRGAAAGTARGGAAGGAGRGGPARGPGTGRRRPPSIKAPPDQAPTAPS